MIFDMKKFQENKKCTSLVERENTDIFFNKFTIC